MLRQSSSLLSIRWIIVFHLRIGLEPFLLFKINVQCYLVGSCCHWGYSSNGSHRWRQLIRFLLLTILFNELTDGEWMKLPASVVLQLLKKNAERRRMSNMKVPTLRFSCNERNGPPLRYNWPWISCDTVATRPSDDDSRSIRRLLRRGDKNIIVSAFFETIKKAMIQC